MPAYDVVVVGLGTGGQTAAFHLSERGLKVAAVERSERLGGTCALVGCQPKKWFYEVTESVAKCRHLLGKGLETLPRTAWGSIRAQKNQFTARVPAGTRKGLAEAGIDLIAGSARFQDRETLQVNGRQLKAPFFVLATGARPMPLPIEGFPHLITSDDFLELDTLPPKILFVGGGFISFEFAHFAARLGPPGGRIIILEVEARPLGPFDADMVDLLVKASAEAGIEVHTGVRIEAVTPLNGGYRVTTASGASFEVDLVVHGAGRLPALAGLDLEACGVAYSAKGIEVDARLRTANPRVFAVGDCIASPQLARVADLEAQVAAENILAELSHAPTGTMDYRAVPSILFTYPQYGMVGQTEQALKRQGIPYTRSFAHNLQWPTYTRVGLNHAAYKILVGADRGILGGHILSDNASGVINTLKLAMVNGIPADSLHRQSLLSPYPTRESDLAYMLEDFLP